MNKNQKLYNVKKFNNVREIIENSANLYGDKLAFKIKNKNDKNNLYREVTYKQFKEDIDALGIKIIEKGLQGKRIAVISPNRYEWILIYCAVLCTNSVIVPLDKGLPENEIESLLERSEADAVFFSKDYIEKIGKIKENNNTKLEQYFCMDKNENNFEELGNLIIQGYQLNEKNNTKYYETKIDNEKMSIIIFTSGTTSISKAVMLNQKAIAENIYALNSAEKIYSTDVNLAFLPLHHAFGSTGILFFLSNGAMNVFCDGLRYIQKNLVEYKVSVFVCVPLLIEAMYKKIMLEVDKQGKTKLIKFALRLSNFLLKFGIDIRRKLFKDIINQLGGNIRFIVSGAAAIDKNVAKAFNDFGILTVQGYGLTETAPVLTAENKKSIKYGSIGLPMCNVEVKIDNPNKEGIGEIIAKGPNVMLGYYKNEEATNEVLQDGWFHTGDLGYMDKDGYIYVTGRKKNVLVLKNGKNVYPEELEILINNLPYIAESMVFGMPKDDDLVVSAKIVYNTEYVKEKLSNLKNPEEIHEYIWKDIKEINKGLTTYKYIKNLITTDEPMIKTTTAKIKRYEEIKKIVNK